MPLAKLRCRLIRRLPIATTLKLGPHASDIKKGLETEMRPNSLPELKP